MKQKKDTHTHKRFFEGGKPTLKLFDNPLPKYLIFLKKLFYAMTVLVYLPKSERRLELAFGANVLHDFSRKNGVI